MKVLAVLQQFDKIITQVDLVSNGKKKINLLAF